MKMLHWTFLCIQNLLIFRNVHLWYFEKYQQKNNSTKVLGCIKKSSGSFDLWLLKC